MLPPSPDHFAPNLLEINTINRIKIELVFDEEINTGILTNESFDIVSAQNETLQVRNITKANTANTISLFTEILQPTTYFLSSTFLDKFGNNRNVVNRKFQASTLIDTFAPRITQTLPKPGSVTRGRKTFVEYNFSEPLDTTSSVNFLVCPLARSDFDWTWTNNWQSLTISASETIPANTIAYFILQPDLKDLEGNYLDLAGYTFFSPETVLPPKIISGQVNFQDKPYKNSIIIFSRDKIMALAVSDASGMFSLRLDTTSYNITAIADTNHDNFIDLFAQIFDFNPQDTIKLNINLIPILEGQEIDKYLD